MWMEVEQLEFALFVVAESCRVYYWERDAETGGQESRMD